MTYNFRMVKKLMTTFMVVSIVVLVFVVFWAAFRTVRIRSANIDAAKASIEQFEDTLLSSYLTDGTYTGTNVSAGVADWIASDSSIVAFVLHDDVSPDYVYARSAEYFGDARFDTPLIKVPEFSYSGVRDRQFSSKIVFPDNSVRVLDVLATVLTRQDIFPIVREVLIILIAFLLFNAICIAVLPVVAAKMEDTAEAFPTVKSDTTADIVDADYDLPVPKGAETEQSVTESLAQDQASSPDDVEDDVADDDEIVIAHIPRDDVESSEDDLDTAGEIPTESDEPENEPSEETVGTPKSPKTGMYSPSSDLGWEEYLEERLNTELRRAASFDQDLVLIVFSLPGVYRNTPEYRQFADAVREYFTFRDLCFEFGPTGIGVVVPNIDLDQGIERYEDFHGASSLSRFKARLCGGISARNGRLIQGNRLIREASRAMEKAKSEEGGVVAFRVDPEKYRTYIASQS